MTVIGQGSLETLGIVLYKLSVHGGAIGYNMIKFNLITKPEFVQKAKNLFWGLVVDFTEGHRVLGSITVFDRTAKIFRKKSQ